MNKLIVLSILLIISCSTPSKKESVSKSEPKQAVRTSKEKTEQEKPPKQKFVHEVLDKDSVWFRDLIPFSTSQDTLISILGKPDSASILNNDCGAYIAGQKPWGDSVKVWYYDETKFVTFKDRAEIMSVKLKGWENTLHHPKIIFSGHTTIEDVSKVFPHSVERSYESKNVTDGKTYRFVKLEPKLDWDDAWQLKFYEDQLIEIIYYIPC